MHPAGRPVEQPRELLEQRGGERGFEELREQLGEWTARAEGAERRSSELEAELASERCDREQAEAQLASTHAELEASRAKRSDLEAERSSLRTQGAAMARELRELEDKVLHLLSTAKGNILDDDNLITTLSDSKIKSSDVEMAQANAAEKEKEINEARELYRPLARLSASVYFAVAALSEVEVMYSWSMAWYEARFAHACKTAPPESSLARRLNSLRNTFTLEIYRSVCRSLFEKHKVLFSLVLTGRVLESDGELDEDEWRFLLAGEAPRRSDAALA